MPDGLPGPTPVDAARSVRHWTVGRPLFFRDKALYGSEESGRAQDRRIGRRSGLGALTRGERLLGPPTPGRPGDGGMRPARGAVPTASLSVRVRPTLSSGRSAQGTCCKAQTQGSGNRLRTGADEQIPESGPSS
ncbi:hypothetical protein NDU88_002369 [Pleurodeles waltl]|uniref:Uncharacterized protein n=1 Tax=Pleurodeles waltl TaxID=8319 RepID=A0AAV7KRY1_PLEWA|nr:hypothetical protein NDU88_002369 [Pleurodeles waltl]